MGGSAVSFRAIYYKRDDVRIMFIIIIIINNMSKMHLRGCVQSFPGPKTKRARQHKTTHTSTDEVLAGRRRTISIAA